MRATQAETPSLLTPPSSPPLLLFEQVSKWYGTVLALNQVTLELTGGMTAVHRALHRAQINPNAIAVYSFAEARWRRIDMREVNVPSLRPHGHMGSVRQA